MEYGSTTKFVMPGLVPAMTKKRVFPMVTKSLKMLAAFSVKF
jgi:hypothetical protein